MSEPLTDEELDQVAERFRYGTNFTVARQLVAEIKKRRAENILLSEALLKIGDVAHAALTEEVTRGIVHQARTETGERR